MREQRSNQISHKDEQKKLVALPCQCRRGALFGFTAVYPNNTR